MGYGGLGNDTLSTINNNDSLFGGDGNDLFLINSTNIIDSYYDGQSGSDIFKVGFILNADVYITGFSLSDGDKIQIAQEYFSVVNYTSSFVVTDTGNDLSLDVSYTNNTTTLTGTINLINVPDFNSSMIEMIPSW